MRFNIALILVVGMIASCLVRPATCQDASDRRGVLKVTVEHTESLDPVPIHLAPGMKWSSEQPLQPAGEEGWIKIPSWLVGLWRTIDSATVYYEKDWSTGKETHPQKINKYRSSKPSRYGEHMDATGGVWHKVGNALPIMGEIPGAIIRGSSVQKSFAGTVDRVIIRNMSTVLYIDGSTRKIKRVTRMETIMTMQPDGEDHMAIDQWTREFDLDGQPTYDFKTRSHARKVGLFVPEQDLSVRKQLAQYFVDNNMEKLLPLKRTP